jgi:hypothetical protein
MPVNILVQLAEERMGELLIVTGATLLIAALLAYLI